MTIPKYGNQQHRVLAMQPTKFAATSGDTKMIAFKHRLVEGESGYKTAPDVRERVIQGWGNSCYRKLDENDLVRGKMAGNGESSVGNRQGLRNNSFKKCDPTEIENSFSEKKQKFSRRNEEMTLDSEEAKIARNKLKLENDVTYNGGNLARQSKQAALLVTSYDIEDSDLNDCPLHHFANTRDNGESILVKEEGDRGYKSNRDYFNGRDCWSQGKKATSENKKTETENPNNNK